MKKQLFTAIVALGFGAVIQPAFADDSADLQKVMAQTSALESQVKSLKQEIRLLKAEQKTLTITEKRNLKNAKLFKANASFYPEVSSSRGLTKTSFPITYLGGTPVVIAPFVGEHSAFDASDLVVNY